MKIILPFVFACLLCVASCNKGSISNNSQGKQLYPLASGNVWIYVDSFFDIYQNYLGKDTFRLKTAKTVNQNNHIYTPITDQFDDSIFTLRSDDTTVFIREPPGESLMFRWPMTTNQSSINNSYFGDSLTSIIYTDKNVTTNYPSYKIVVTQDDGLWYDYKQQEFYFTVGLGIIKGRDLWKNFNGDIYVSDSYRLISYNIY